MRRTTMTMATAVRMERITNSHNHPSLLVTRGNKRKDNQTHPKRIIAQKWSVVKYLKDPAFKDLSWVRAKAGSTPYCTAF